jgi:hypothetical protein
VRKSRSTNLVLLAAAGAAAAGSALALTHASRGGPNLDVRSDFAVFHSLPPSAPPSEIASSPSLSGGEIAQTRVLGADLGRFHSRLFIYPSNDNRNVCFGLVARSPKDPGMVYCYSPGNSSAPPEIAGEHFSVVAPESVSEGTVGVQLFGVVDDDVASARVQVRGEWRSIQLARNGFYLDLPGVGYDQMGRFEATLKDGTTQAHDIQTGSRIA